MINDVIRFIGELIFQMSYYGILVAQRIFMAILMIFCPIMFALSLAPPWNSAWSQWMSKYLSLSLWGFVTYMCLYYIDFILLYNLQQDLVAYDHLLHGSVNSWEQIGALGLQASARTACTPWVCLSVPTSSASSPKCLLADTGRRKFGSGFRGRLHRHGNHERGRLDGRKCGRLDNRCGRSMGKSLVK